MRDYKSPGRVLFQIVNCFALTLICLTCILPFVNLLAVSFSSSSQVSAGNVVFLPKEFTTFSYEYALSNGAFLKAMWVSVKRVALGLAINMVLMITCAYPLSKTKNELMGRNFYMGFFVLTMLITGGMIPTYLVVAKLGLKDTLWSLVLPGALPVYNMVILMNFMRGIPKEIEESAIIDGACPFQILLKILLPILKPSLATVGLFCIVWHWNDWFGGMLYMNNPDNFPLQTYLRTLLLNFESIMQNSNSDYSQLLALMNQRTGRAAQLFLAAIPVMIIYIPLQKYFTKGLVLGSVKG